MADYFANSRNRAMASLTVDLDDLLDSLRTAYENGDDPTPILADLDANASARASAESGGATAPCFICGATIDLDADEYEAIPVYERLKFNFDDNAQISYRDGGAPQLLICSLHFADEETYISDQLPS